jgi:hypothetical protein
MPAHRVVRSMTRQEGACRRGLRLQGAPKNATGLVPKQDRALRDVAAILPSDQRGRQSGLVSQFNGISGSDQSHTGTDIPSKGG